MFSVLVWPSVFCGTAVPVEKVFADYFDIPVGSGAGTEVIGRIHIERNKDVLKSPVPEGYKFEIVEQDGAGIFTLDTRRDLSGRLMGVFSVAKGKTADKTPAQHHLKVALKDGDKELQRFDVKIRVVKQTLLATLRKRYMPALMGNDRMYGRKKFSDKQVAEMIDALRANDWKFPGLEKCYRGRPQDYVFKLDPNNDHAPTGTIEYDWEKVVNNIGGLGLAYAQSDVYGPKGDAVKRAELRDALYNAILTYTRSVPVDGSELLIDGKPVGDCIGDGFALLQHHKMAGMQTPTHQWNLTDGLMIPAVHLMPDILDGIKRGDKLSEQVQDALIRYLQIFFAEIKSRRAIDNPGGRWGELQDTTYSAGAWADANLGHRSRTLLALPFIWADYNRPLTYVQYWYTDYYGGKPFEGFSFQTGWSPHGIISDLSYWMTKYNIITHRYIQSGFQPDGTISHHIGHATDAAMVAYGFEWLTDCNKGYNYFKDTRYRVPDDRYQFQADRLLRVYPRLFYKQRMDFLVSGRSFLDPLTKFVTKRYPQAVKALLNARSKDTKIEGIEELQDICTRIKDNTYEHSGTDAYWVNEFLVHRRGEHEAPFYASLKLKSERTVGAEDFSKKVRRSWNMGYGILPVKVAGDEYSEKVICNYDWHALPGLTEEWRTDPMPVKGGAQASLPGINKISGVTSDGRAGMGIYHHLTGEKYSSATASKSYHFIEDKIVSMGTAIDRVRPGQGQPIVTFVDQTAFTGPLTWNDGRATRTVAPGEDADIATDITGPTWLHHGGKGYVVLPAAKQRLLIKSGKNINVTDRSIANGNPGFIIALSHGEQPGEEYDASYRYVQLPNVTAGEMPARVKSLLADVDMSTIAGDAHAIYSKIDRTRQYAFFKPASISAGGIEASADAPAQLMLREEDDRWVLTASNPAPDGVRPTLTFHLSEALPTGTYSYTTAGVYPLEGETVTVTPDGKGCTVTVELPDARDAAKYNYQSDLYAASPITVYIPKK